MSEDQSQIHDDHSKAQRAEHGQAQPGAGLEGLPTPGLAPSYPTSLLGDPRLDGRGNEPVHIALMRQAQRAYGNRAVQRQLANQGQKTSMGHVARAVQRWEASRHELPSIQPFSTGEDSGRDGAGTSMGRPQASEGVQVQAKLEVGAPGDHYEQEADRVAEQVMSMPAATDTAGDTAHDAAPSTGAEGHAPVQRQVEEAIQTKPLAASITPYARGATVGTRLLPRPAPIKEDRPVQTKRLTGPAPIEEDRRIAMKSLPGVQRSVDQVSTTSEGEVAGDVESTLSASRGGGSPLPASVQAFMEPRFGADFSSVRVHTGNTAVQMNRELGAHAFTHGTDIYYGEGNSPGNDPLTAHELTHVVQQTGHVKRQVAPPQNRPGASQGVAQNSQVLSHLQAMQSQPGFDSSLYRKEIAEFQQSNSTEQIMGKQLQLLPAQEGVKVENRDHSQALRRCGGPTGPAITHETRFSAPDGSPKTRTNVGVGEEVTFKGPSAGDWTASAGTPSAQANTDTFVWTAPNRATSATIKLKVGTQESTVTMRVLEPSSITATKVRDLTFPGGTQGAGMELRFIYHPLTVSFGNVESKEVSGPASNVRGYYKGKEAELWHDSGDTFLPIREDNTDSAIDTASFSGEPKPWSKGGFDWVIPNKFKVSSEGGDGKQYTTVTQAFTIAADGTSSVSKAGQSTTRTP
jgi:hypothetical protein